MNTQYSGLVGALSRALGNTLVQAEEQEGRLLLTLAYSPKLEEREQLRQFIRLCLPRHRIKTFAGATIIIA